MKQILLFNNEQQLCIGDTPVKYYYECEAKTDHKREKSGYTFLIESYLCIYSV